MTQINEAFTCSVTQAIIQSQILFFLCCEEVTLHLRIRAQHLIAEPSGNSLHPPPAEHKNELNERLKKKTNAALILKKSPRRVDQNAGQRLAPSSLAGTERC